MLFYHVIQVSALIMLYDNPTYDKFPLKGQNLLSTVTTNDFIGHFMLWHIFYFFTFELQDMHLVTYMHY